MNSPKDYLTDRVTNTEKLLKEYFSFNGKAPLEVIFSAGVNDTIIVLPWFTFVKAISALLEDEVEKARLEGYRECARGEHAEYKKEKALENIGGKEK